MIQAVLYKSPKLFVYSDIFFCCSLDIIPNPRHTPHAYHNPSWSVTNIANRKTYPSTIGLRAKYYWSALITFWALVSSTVVLVTWTFPSDLLQEYQTDSSSGFFSPQHLDLLWEITENNIFQFPICKATCNKKHISLNALQHQLQFQTSKLLLSREARQFWK